MDPSALVTSSASITSSILDCPSCHGEHDCTDKITYLTAPPSLVVAINRPSTILSTEVGPVTIVDRSRINLSSDLVLSTVSGTFHYQPVGFIQRKRTTAEAGHYLYVPYLADRTLVIT